jgi:hypothetical protein
MASEPVPTYPSELPVIPLRQTVVFPLTLQPLAINRALSIESVNRALAGDRLLFLSLQNSDHEEPGPDDLRRVGLKAVDVPAGAIPKDGERPCRASARSAQRDDVRSSRNADGRVESRGAAMTQDR